MKAFMKKSDTIIHAAVPEARGGPAVECDAEDGADAAGVLEPDLPRTRDLVAGAWVVAAVFLLEGWVAEDVAHQDRVVAFHHDGHGDDGGPEHGFAIRADGLPEGCADGLREGCAVLCVGGILCVVEGVAAEFVFDVRCDVFDGLVDVRRVGGHAGRAWRDGVGARRAFWVFERREGMIGKTQVLRHSHGSELGLYLPVSYGVCFREQCDSGGMIPQSFAQFCQGRRQSVSCASRVIPGQWPHFAH